MRLYSNLRDLLAARWLGNPVSAWLTAAAILVGGFLLLVLVRRLLVRRLERFAEHTHTPLDDLALDALRRTSTAFLLVVAVAAAARTSLALPEHARTGVALLARIAFLLQAASWGNGAITFWLQRLTAQRAATDRASITTLAALGVLARFVLWVLLFLLALDAFGVNITALVTGLGIAGVAVALAVQNVLGDLLASLSIALDKPFVIGDFIVVDTFQGTVEDIGLKTTRLRSLSGEQLVFANAELLKARIRNFGRMAERRVLFQLSVQYDTPPDLVERIPQLVREVVSAETPVRFDRSHFSAFTDSALVIETVYYVLSAEYNVYMDIQQRVNLTLMRRFAELGVEFAYPTRTVVLRGAADDGTGMSPRPAPQRS
jgi:small-conductance mechanosensitive channel